MDTPLRTSRCRGTELHVVCSLCFFITVVRLTRVMKFRVDSSSLLYIRSFYHRGASESRCDAFLRLALGKAVGRNCLAAFVKGKSKSFAIDRYKEVHSTHQSFALLCKLRYNVVDLDTISNPLRILSCRFCRIAWRLENIYVARRRCQFPRWSHHLRDAPCHLASGRGKCDQCFRWIEF